MKTRWQKLAVGALLAACLMMGGAAQAEQALDADNTKRFVESLGPIMKFGDELEAAGRDKVFDETFTPKAGEDFKPYTKGLAALKAQQPADYAKVGELIAPHGFSSTALWAEIADKVMAAYFALSMEGQGGMPQMGQMTPEMLAMMPPEVRAQFEGAQSMQKAIQSVPAEDKQLVAPYKARIDQLTDGAN